MKSKSQTDQILSRIGDSRLADLGEAGTFAAYVAADVERVLNEYYASWPKPSTFDVNAKHHILAKCNMVWEFGDYLPDNLKPKKKEKGTGKPPVHQEPKF